MREYETNYLNISSHAENEMKEGYEQEGRGGIKGVRKFTSQSVARFANMSLPRKSTGGLFAEIAQLTCDNSFAL